VVNLGLRKVIKVLLSNTSVLLEALKYVHMNSECVDGMDASGELGDKRQLMYLRDFNVWAAACHCAACWHPDRSLKAWRRLRGTAAAATASYT
jgi:hypothetical protein